MVSFCSWTRGFTFSDDGAPSLKMFDVKICRQVFVTKTFIAAILLVEYLADILLVELFYVYDLSVTWFSIGFFVPVKTSIRDNSLITGISNRSLKVTDIHYRTS